MIYMLIIVMTGVVAALLFANIRSSRLALATVRPPVARSASARRARASQPPVQAPAGRAPPPKPSIAWDGSPVATAVAPAPAAPAVPSRASETSAFVPTHFAGSAVQRKIRDRYISIRFPGVASSSVDLAESERVIKASRLYFDEKKSDRALELLGLAIEQSPGDESLRLAQLEIAFLERDARLYCALAREFQSSHATSSQLEEVARLGRALAPDETIFGIAQPMRAHEHYGPWPNTPNWIQAPWDLTSEILGSDHHRAMRPAMHTQATEPAARKVA
jgi:hypothetical protein